MEISEQQKRSGVDWTDTLAMQRTQRTILEIEREREGERDREQTERRAKS